MEDDGEGCSRLATKQHWIEHYKLELKNFNEFGDGGEVWFGRNIEQRMVKYITEERHLPKKSKIIDFGCGNGSLLRALCRQGFVHLCGVDYSEEAILLAKKITEKESVGNECCQIDFQVADLIDESLDLEKFDVIFDKGTWDALSLSPDRDCRLKNYKTNVCKTLNHSGLFIICSCNYTREELRKQFDDEELQFVEELAHQSVIVFSGHLGSTTTSAVFQRL